MGTSTPFVGTTADTASALAGFFDEDGVRDVRAGATGPAPGARPGESRARTAKASASVRQGKLEMFRGRTRPVMACGVHEAPDVRRNPTPHVG